MRIFMPTVLNPSGISKASREVFKLVKHLGLRISTLLTLDEQVGFLEKEVSKKMIAESVPFSDEVIHLHVGPPNNMSVVKDAKAIVGMFVMEGQRLSSIQSEPCRMADVIAVPSSFCAKACLASGIPKEKLRVVPYPLDTSIWNIDVKPSLPRDERFRFVYVNSIYERKGLDVLLRAYWEEFRQEDPVLLVVKSYRENDRQVTALNYIQKLAKEYGINPETKAPIAIIDEPIKDDDLPSFIKSFDALVSPHRSEGFGMSPWYAMSLGVPVICTNYGGVTDFANEDTAWLVEVDHMRNPSKKEVGIFAHLKDISWAEPSASSLGAQMRACAVETEERKRKASNGAQLVADKYNFDVVGELFMEALEIALPGAKNRIDKDMDDLEIPPKYSGKSPAVMIKI